MIQVIVALSQILVERITRDVLIVSIKQIIKYTHKLTSAKKEDR